MNLQWRWHQGPEVCWNFPTGTIFMAFDAKIQPEFVSPSLVCFPKYPFTLELCYPLFGIIFKIFQVIKISYIHFKPTVWRILYWINHFTRSRDLTIGLNELDFFYDLKTFRNSHFMLKVKTDKPTLVLKSKHNDGAWKWRYFFLKRNSIFDWNLYHNLGLKRLGFLLYIKNLEIHASYFVWCFVAVNFDELVPPTEDTDDRIKSFLIPSES